MANKSNSLNNFGNYLCFICNKKEPGCPVEGIFSYHSVVPMGLAWGCGWVLLPFFRPYRTGFKAHFNKSKITIATKHEVIAKKFFEQKAMAVDIIKLYGSIELAPLVGLCDCIVDIVETGETMKQNGLEVGPTIMETTAHLIANKNSFYAKKDLIFDLKDKLEKFL